MVRRSTARQSVTKRELGYAKLIFLCAASASPFVRTGYGATFVPTTGTVSWNTASNWSPSGVPNAVGASASFNQPTGAETVELRAAITAGSIDATNNSSNVLTLANGTGGSLTLDALGTADAIITYSGSSTTTNAFTISATTTLTDTLRFINNNTAGTGAGTATITGLLSGAGGFIKDGGGRFSFTTAAKTYTGATTINSGRLRYSTSGLSTGTSSISVNSGGALFIDGGGSFGFGSSSSVLVTLNGAGDVGDAAASRGALTASGSATTLSNNVSFASDATIAPAGSTLTLSGAISGPGTFVKNGAGTVSLTGSNASFTGGTTVNSGSVTTSSASRLGTGALRFEQAAGVGTSVTLNNAAQTVSALSSGFTDTTGTQTQLLTLNGTALTVNQATNTTFGIGSTPTLTSRITGNGSLIKSGPGTLVLTSANGYTGGTIISAGTLLASNGETTGGSATGTGNVTVNGGTLGGIGTFTGGAVINAGGTITAGTSTTVGTLSTGSNTSFNGTGTALVNYASAGASMDLISVLGSLALANANGFQLAFVKTDASTLAVGVPYVVARSMSVTGFNPAAFVLTVDGVGLTYGTDYTVSDSDTGATAFALTITLNSAPEPTTAALSLLGGSVLLTRRRKRLSANVSTRASSMRFADTFAAD